MENRVSVISIIIEDADAAPRVNDLLHENRNYVIGRMGIPYKERGVSIISVVMDGAGRRDQRPVGKAGHDKRRDNQNTDCKAERLMLASGRGLPHRMTEER